MEKDIEIKINSMFGVESTRAKKILKEFEKEQGLSPRISRCIVYLSEGSISKMQQAINDAKIDWRDIIMDAETVDFEYNEPFK